MFLSQPLSANESPSVNDIILDIYNAMTELGQAEFEQIQSDLYALHESPIDLNHTSEEELASLYFLSPQQIDALLSYADQHPFVSLYELRMIPCLTDYEIRNLQPFVRLGSGIEESSKTMHVREVFAHASHELITRVDARNIEGYEGTDPMYVQGRYRFDFQRRVIFGGQLRRPAGGDAKDLEYGAYLQLNDIGMLHTLVAGNFQASFGQGLVFANAFHAGKSSYVLSAGQQRNGLRYYSSVNGNGLHGVGATIRKDLSPHTRIDATALYSMKRANDSIWHHVLGANMTLRHRRIEVQLNVAENIYSDSIRPYRNTGYNAHYFRGRHQAVIGAAGRYNHGWFDLFGEIATSQNRERWGIGTILGSRFYPTHGVSLVAFYRYYSPHFDNALGYAFSESSRIGDENGGYIGFDITRWRKWRVTGYGDIFYFTGPKYGIPTYPTLGYDAMIEVSHQPSAVSLRLRARQKGESIYSARGMWNWSRAGLSLRTTVDANVKPSAISSQPSGITYGLSVAQDIGYDFSSLGRHVPIRIQGRLQGFDVRNWDNRIYLYEHDVLYSFSIPATYGLGGRGYVSLRWQILPQLAMYLRVSETVYARSWAEAHSRPQTRTDVHLLVRAKL